MEIFLRLYGLLNKIVNYLITPILMLIFGGYKKSDRLPKIENPILEICAVDLAEKIRNREVSDEPLRWFLWTANICTDLMSKIFKFKT